MITEIYCPRLKMNYFGTNPQRVGERTKFTNIRRTQRISFVSKRLSQLDEETLLYEGDSVISSQGVRS